MCGQIGLAPAQFYALTYAELKLIIEGWTQRRKGEAKARRADQAWMLSWLLIPHQKEGADLITPDVILGRKPRKPRVKFESSADACAAFFAARSEQERKRA